MNRDAQAALNAALEDLARVTRERDGLAAALKSVQYHTEILAAHDQVIAARVLREAGSHVLDGLAWDAIKRLADAYGRGEREVPGD